MLCVTFQKDCFQNLVGTLKVSLKRWWGGGGVGGGGGVSVLWKQCTQMFPVVNDLTKELTKPPGQSLHFGLVGIPSCHEREMFEIWVYLCKYVSCICVFL